MSQILQQPDSSAPPEPIPIQPAIFMLACFALGIVLDRWLDINWKISIVAILIGVSFWWLAQRKSRLAVAATMMSVALIASGAFYHHGRWNWFAANDIANFCDTAPGPICLRGKIVSEARYRAKQEESLFDAMPRVEKTTFQFRPRAVRNGANWLPVSGDATLTIRERVDHLRCGCEVELVGQLSRIPKPSSPGQFDFQNHFRARKQTCAVHCNFAESVVVRRQTSRLSGDFLLSTIRARLDKSIQQHVGAEQAGFASALLLGNREQLSAGKRDSFLRTGTAHLLAISGLHVGILASIFLLAYRFGLLGRRRALLLTIAFVISYAWLVEFRPPVSRAAILLSLFCVGRLIGRTGNDYSLLAIAGFVVLLINPGDLFQLGPQLSFLAFATIIMFKEYLFPGFSDDPIDRLIRNTRPTHVRLANNFGRGVRQTILVSALIWLVGLPLVARNFNLVTPIALAVNPVVLFPIAISLFAGLGVCCFGGWFPLAADVCGAVCGFALQSVDWLISVAESIAGGHWWTSGPTLVATLSFYALLLVFALASYSNRNPVSARTFAVGWVTWVLFAWLLPFHVDKWNDSSQHDSLQATFVDLGHGSSVLLQLPGGKTMLYDAGSMASSRFAVETISKLLWEQKVEHLDSILISHADLDHLNAIPGIVERFSVGKIYVSSPMFAKVADSAVLQELMKRVADSNVVVEQITLGDVATVGGNARLQVLSPPSSGTASSINSDSVVLLIEIDNKRILLPGDLELRGLQMLLSREPIECDVVMLPHHGSKNSHPAIFTDWCDPEAVIVNASVRKLDESVLDNVKAPDRTVLTTAHHGTIRVEFVADQPERISHWTDDRWTTLPR